MSTELAIKSALESTGKYVDVTAIEGGMNGYAFDAKNQHVDRRVFLKAVYMPDGDNSQILNEIRCIAEATADVGAKQHIVEVFDGESLRIGNENYICFQMEFIEGPNLGTIIEKAPMGQQDAVRIANDILNGLGHLHHKRILHRDIKPHNIMLAGATPKISDFGSATYIQPTQTSVSASRHSALYVPPEGWDEPSRYNFVSDIYQAGIVLYEMVNGCLNYSEQHYLTSSIERAMRQNGPGWEDLSDFERTQWVNKGLNELSQRGKLLAHGRAPTPYYSSKLARIIKKATHSEPGSRYASATQFSSALQKVSLPNWKQVGCDSFIAIDWRGCDWTVRYHQKSGSRRIETLKCKTGTAKPRRFNPNTFTTLKSAFDYIEKLPVR